MKIVDLINEKEADLKKHNDSEEAAVEAEAKVPEVKQESEKKIEETEMVKNDVAKNESESLIFTGLKIPRDYCKHRRAFLLLYIQIR